ncbi:fibrous sheath CABYR-binding protein-like [Anguilla rostrata]|uniref:fibrous sheath CABYR-binding protein-like n=1 Tax=Anguilla rostrata TaxID=7938 RepID=UPI0030CCEB63
MVVLQKWLLSVGDMMGAVKMMAVASVEVAAASVGDSAIAASVRVLEEELQVGEEPKALEEELQVGEKGVVPAEAVATPVGQPEDVPAEVAGEAATLEEVTVVTEPPATAEAPPVEVEAEMEAGAAAGSDEGPGEEIQAGVLEVAPEPAVPSEDTDTIPLLEGTSDVLAHRSLEAVAEETLAAVATEHESAAAQKAEQAEDSAPSGEEDSQAEEPAVATAAEVAGAEEPSDLGGERGGIPIAMPTLAITLPSPALHELHLEPTAGPAAWAASGAEAAPPAGLEDQVAEDVVAGEESTVKPSPVAEQQETALLEDPHLGGGAAGDGSAGGPPAG